MSIEEYNAWSELQEDRYEYVDGFPVLRRPEGDAQMMSGASHRHDRIVVNCLVALAARLAGRSCQPFTADMAIETSRSRRRRPDVGVECGTPQDLDSVADDPRVVIEMLSPSTREFDLLGKLDEYKALGSLAHNLVIEPNAPEARLWSRGPDGSWESRAVQGLEDEISLGAVELVLPMRGIYARLDFPPRPRLVPG